MRRGWRVRSVGWFGWRRRRSRRGDEPGTWGEFIMLDSLRPVRGRRRVPWSWIGVLARRLGTDHHSSGPLLRIATNRDGLVACPASVPAAAGEVRSGP